MGLTKTTYAMIRGAVYNILDFMPANIDLTTTDVTSYVQNALNTIPEGSTLHFPTGTYYIVNVTANKSLRLTGDGQYATMIVRTTGSETTQSDLFSFGSVTSTDPFPDFIEIFNMGFDQGWSSGGGSVYSCVRIYRYVNIKVKNCYFTKAQYHGLKFNGSQNALIDSCHFKECYYDGIGAGGRINLTEPRTKQIIVTNNLFENVFGGSVIQVGVDDVLITNNIFNKSSIQFGQDVNQVRIVDNYVYGVNTYGYQVPSGSAYTGIFCEGDNLVTIANNQLEYITGTASGVTYNGIWVDGSQLDIPPAPIVQIPANATIIANNYLRYVKNQAIQITAASEDGSQLGNEFSISDNQINNCGDGIVMTGANNILISGNSINTIDYQGISIALCTQVRITTNTICNVSSAASNSYNGITIASQSYDVVIMGNTVIDNRGTYACMRFGVFDSVKNDGDNSYLRSQGNMISGALANNWYPAPAIPLLGNWLLGDTVQQIDSNSPIYWICTVSGAPGTWAAAG